MAMGLGLGLRLGTPVLAKGGGVFIDDLGRPISLFVDDLNRRGFFDDLNRKIN
ncbi:MAG: hypothetical protein ACK4SQ_14305 [Allorhizobium sp.]